MFFEFGKTFGVFKTFFCEFKNLCFELLNLILLVLMISQRDP